MAQYDPIAIKSGILTVLGTDTLRANRIAAAGLTVTGLASGDVCQVSGALTLAKAVNTSTSPIVGIYDGASNSVVRKGIVVATFKSGLTLANGDTVWLSSTAGALTNVKPTADTLHEVGVVVDASSSRILFQPKPPIVLSVMQPVLVHWTLDEAALPFLNTGSLGSAADLKNEWTSSYTPNQTGKINKAIRFLSGGNGYVYTDNGACQPQLGVDGCTGITVAGWVYEYSHRAWAAIWAKWAHPTVWTSYWYSVVCQTNSNGSDGGWVGLKLSGMGYGDWYSSGLGYLPLNQWNHVAMTYDGENLRSYLNGSKITTTPRNPAFGPNINWFSSGRWGVGASGYPETLDGLVDDVQIAPEVWSDDYIAAQAAI